MRESQGPSPEFGSGDTKRRWVRVQGVLNLLETPRVKHRRDVE